MHGFIGTGMIYNFTENIITLKVGKKAAADYLIFHNGVQITDKDFFEMLYAASCTEEDARLLLRAFIEAKSIKLQADAVQTIPSPLIADDVYAYCVSQSRLTTVLQELLFVALLRCDIDNICYPPPRLNGCIRLFVQMVTLFALKYNWQGYSLIPLNQVKETNHAMVTFDIGFPDNKYGIATADFKTMYSKIYGAYKIEK